MELGSADWTRRAGSLASGPGQEGMVDFAVLKLGAAFFASEMWPAENVRVHFGLKKRHAFLDE